MHITIRYAADDTVHMAIKITNGDFVRTSPTNIHFTLSFTQNFFPRCISVSVCQSDFSDGGSCQFYVKDFPGTFRMVLGGVKMSLGGSKKIFGEYGEGALAGADWPPK